MEENSSPRPSATTAWVLCAFLMLFCVMRLVEVMRLSDLAHAKQVLFLSSFGIEMALITMHSIILAVFLPAGDNRESVIAPVMDTLLGYHIVRLCFTCIIGSFLFTSLFRLLLLYFPFNGFVYACALVLMVLMVLSLLRMASIVYAHRIKKGSRQ